MAEYSVAERFVSINGEGTRAGQLAVFLRFGGCNLNCSYCDTAWAKDKVDSTDSEEQLYQFVKESGIANVTLTGGEPLIQPGIMGLLAYFSRDHSLNLEIETNGSVSIREIQQLDNPPSLTMDYKLPSSGMGSFMRLENFDCLQKKDTVKFVAGGLEDLEKAKQIIHRYDLAKRCHVFFSPVFGRIAPADIVEYMKKNRMNGASLQLQLHKLIWSPTERGV